MQPKDFPLRVWGVVWQKGADGGWERHLIRRTNAGKFVSDTLVHVESTAPVCLHCLSQHTEVLTTGELHCMTCKVVYQLIEEELL